jgi:hypothetical protein
MTSALKHQSLDQIFRSARTPNGWTDLPVEEDTVRERLFAVFGLVAAEPVQGG